jgi:hypothetical protein
LAQLTSSILEASSLDQPAFLREKVLLTPDGVDENGEPQYQVHKGFLRVAFVMVEAAMGSSAWWTEQVGLWIQESNQAEDEAASWRARWHSQLVENPALEASLARSPEDVYDRAGLTFNERLAMKMFVNHGMNPRQVGIALHVPDSTVRNRLERAAAKMRQLGSRATSTT